jgi:1-deoxy-D-xylulose 5-phosphate reductoisomerase
MKFTEIPVLVERILDKHVSISKPTIEDIMAVSDQVQQQCREIFKGDNW